MRGLVIFLLILMVLSSFSFTAASISNKKIEAKQDTQIFKFATFTSAVCEDSGDFVHCKDEIFVNCNGEISKIDDVVECNGIKFTTQKASGFAVFEKDWKDPRS